MMVEILGITDNFSVALKRLDQDVLNALSHVNDTKRQLQEIMNEGGKNLCIRLLKIRSKHDIYVLDMDAPYV